MTDNEHNPQDIKTSSSQASEGPAEALIEKRKPHFLNDLLTFSIIAILIVAPIRLFIAQPFIVSGASMEPTFKTGEYLIVDQLSYNFDAPQRGEVIIFRYPKDPSKFFIKRVVGLPNETVDLYGKEVVIKNSKHPDGIILDEPYLEDNNRNVTNMTTVLGDNEYFVLGDNRRASSDSRTWGPLAEDFIVGRAFVRLFPIMESSLLPGDYTGPSN